jgi:hypothetical protein
MFTKIAPQFRKVLYKWTPQEAKLLQGLKNLISSLEKVFYNIKKCSKRKWRKLPFSSFKIRNTKPVFPFVLVRYWPMRRDDFQCEYIKRHFGRH